MYLVIAKPPFSTEGRRWASERGKIRTSDLWPPLRSITIIPPSLECGSCESSNLLGKRKQFLPGIPLSKKPLSQWSFGISVQATPPFIWDLPPQVSPSGSVCARWAHSQLDQQLAPQQLDQGKHSDLRRELIHPRYNLDVGYQNASWSLWSLKWCEAAVSIFSQRWWMDGKS